MHIWGPEFAGNAEVHLKVIGIRIDFAVCFGAGLAQAKAIDWQRVRAAFLPAQPIAMTCRKGALVGSSDQVWQVDPHDVVIDIALSAPLVDAGHSQAHGLPPLGVPSGKYESSLKLAPRRDGQDIDVTRHFAVDAIRGSVPAWLWGASKPSFKDNAILVSEPSLNGDRTLDEAVIGRRLSLSRSATSTPRWIKHEFTHERATMPPPAGGLVWEVVHLGRPAPESRQAETAHG